MTGEVGCPVDLVALLAGCPRGSVLKADMGGATKKKKIWVATSDFGL